MNELQVIVQQEPGVVRWNFEDLKTALQEELKVYEGMIYDDGSIKTAKSDAAMLRKLKKAVEDKRKEIKNKCLEPYEVIEAQAKELNALIDKPIDMITAQVSDYEAKQKEANKAKIVQYMTDAFSDLPEDIAKKAQFAVYDPRWENATAKKSEWKAAVDNMNTKIMNELATLNRMEDNEEYRDAAISVYRQNLDINAAIEKLTDLHHQEQLILEKQKREAEAAAKAAGEKQAQEEPAVNHALDVHSYEQMSSPAVNKYEPEPATKKHNGLYDATIIIKDAPKDKLDKIIDYVKFMGVQYEAEVSE